LIFGKRRSGWLTFVGSGSAPAKTDQSFLTDPNPSGQTGPPDRRAIRMCGRLCPRTTKCRKIQKPKERSKETRAGQRRLKRNESRYRGWGGVLRACAGAPNATGRALARRQPGSPRQWLRAKRRGTGCARLFSSCRGISRSSLPARPLENWRDGGVGDSAGNLID